MSCRSSDQPLYMTLFHNVISRQGENWADKVPSAPKTIRMRQPKGPELVSLHFIFSSSLEGRPISVKVVRLQRPCALGQPAAKSSWLSVYVDIRLFRRRARFRTPTAQ